MSIDQGTHGLNSKKYPDQHAVISDPFPLCSLFSGSFFSVNSDTATVLHVHFFYALQSVGE